MIYTIIPSYSEANTCLKTSLRQVLKLEYLTLLLSQELERDAQEPCIEGNDTAIGQPIRQELYSNTLQ
jgi:hypothetical protein